MSKKKGNYCGGGKKAEVDQELLDALIYVDVKELAHCRVCCDPLYIIYDARVRDICYQCDLEERIDSIA